VITLTPKESTGMADRHEIAVHNNPDANRYEAIVDDKLAGIAVYRLTPGRVVFVDTEVCNIYQGQGVGGALAKAALDDVRRQGKQAEPLCSFIAAYIRRHPDYVDLVDETHHDPVLPDS
jgi:uncharacterized protein